MTDVRNRRRRQESKEMIDESTWRTPAEIGVELQRIRAERGWTLSEIAERDPFMGVERMAELEAGTSHLTAKELVHLDELYGLANHDITVRPDAPVSERLKIERGTLRLYEDMYELMSEHDLDAQGLSAEEKAQRLAGVSLEIDEQRRRVAVLEAQVLFHEHTPQLALSSVTDESRAVDEPRKGIPHDA